MICKNQTKIATVSAATQKCKMAAMTSSNSKFQKPRKMTLANICQMICGKFHQNRFIRLGCRDDTHRRTHIHTDTHTPWVRLQHIQSKWLNIKKIGVFRVPLPKKNRVGRSAKLLIFAKHDFTIIFRLKFRVVKEQMSECIVIYSKYTENTVERSVEEDRHWGVCAQCTL